jgi:ferredoxin-NADP reductase
MPIVKSLMSRDVYDQFLLVRNILEETPETKSFSLDLASEPFRFQPGQFVNVTVELLDKRRAHRAYSIASSPLDPDLVLTVKRMQAGVVSKHLCDQFKVGDLLHIRGPYGRFTLDETVRDAVFIAAGSGIVPFRSMWRYVLQTGVDTRWSLLYASRSLRYAIYRDELRALSQSGFRVIHTFTENDDPLWTGYSRRIDREMLVEFVEHFEDKIFYICGPPEFCNSTAAHLMSLKVERERIKTERYD